MRLVVLKSFCHECFLSPFVALRSIVSDGVSGVGVGENRLIQPQRDKGFVAVCLQTVDAGDVVSPDE